jgi:hypothetical protein
MLQLDSYLNEIEEKHEEEFVRESYAVPRTIGEKIALERKNALTQWSMRRSSSTSICSETTAGSSGEEPPSSRSSCSMRFSSANCLDFHRYLIIDQLPDIPRLDPEWNA